MSRGVTSATYVYGLVPGTRPPSVSQAPPGLPGAGPVRAVPAGDGLWLVVADAPVSRYGKGPIERGLKDLEWVSACAVAHERVVEHFGSAGTVVPMKLFTLFTSDERAASHVAKARRRIERVLKRVAGRQEWGVRLAFDISRAGAAARDEAGGGAAGLTSGTRFLLRKKEDQEQAQRLAEEARKEAARVFRELSRRADEARLRAPAPVEGRKRLLLDAAFLVPAKKAAGFRGALEGIRKRLDARGYEVTLTGPWPPYNFIAEEA